MPPTFAENSTSASNISENLLKLNDGDNITRIVSNYWQEIPEIWITTDQGPRRFRATEEVQKIIAESGADISVKSYFYSPAIDGQKVKVKLKSGKIAKRIQLNDECKILRYGKGIFRKLKQLHDNDEFPGDVTVRNLTITRTKKGGKGGITFYDYDLTPSPKETSLPTTLEGVDDIIAEIETHANEVVDLNYLRRILGLVGDDVREDNVPIEEGGEDEELNIDDSTIDEDDDSIDSTEDNEAIDSTEDDDDEGDLVIDEDEDEDELTIEEDEPEQPKVKPKTAKEKVSGVKKPVKPNKRNK